MENWEKQQDKDGYPDEVPCKYCDDKGWYWVQNGPDDCDKEPCDMCDAWENIPELVNKEKG